jgi:hypothetical protein
MNAPDDRPLPTWPLRLAALVLTLLGIVPMANIVAQGEGLAWWGPSVRLWIVWSTITVIAAVGIARVMPRACDRAIETAHRWLLRPSAASFALVVAAATTALSLLLSWKTFHFQPVTIDELSVQLQARLLAHGRLFAAAEPHPEFFGTMQTLAADGRWFTHFPIGASALLAPGMAIGAPWLVNPILAGVAAIIVYAFARQVTSESLARAIAVLFALSPFVLLMAATQLDHVGAVVFAWLAIAALPGWLAASDLAGASKRAALIGACVAVAATIRPYDTALMALAIGAFQLWAVRRNAVLARSLVAQVAAGLVPVAVLLACNAATTGHPLTFAYDLLNGAQHQPGFHVDPFGFVHTPRRGLFNISAYVMRLDIALLAWPVPALVLVVAALGWQRRADRWDYLLVGMLGAILAGYWAYWGEGRSPGPRFLFAVAPVFLLYVARFPGELRDRSRGELTRRASGILVPVWLLAAWLSPPMTAQPFGVWTLSRRLAERDIATPMILDAVSRAHLAHAVVFLDDGWHARLASRLRSLGAPPFMAQRIVGSHDACMLQQLLDSAEHSVGPRARQSELVFGALARAHEAPPIRGLPALEQLALDPARPRTQACEQSLSGARSNGLDLARFLPLESPDSLGRLGGDVIYVRDHGERNALLRARFADRGWYRARLDRKDGRLTATIVPIANR